MLLVCPGMKIEHGTEREKWARHGDSKEGAVELGRGMVLDLNLTSLKSEFSQTGALPKCVSLAIKLQQTYQQTFVHIFAV